MKKKLIKSGNLVTLVGLKKYAIVILEQNGKSLKNEWGGYTTLHVGSETYIQKKWNQLKTYYSYL